MRNRFRVLVAAILFAGLAGSSSVPARATDLPVEGGPGGGPFRAQCPAGRFLVGVSIRAGAWLDAIFPLCAGFVPDQRMFAGITRGSRHGGTGGSPLLRDGTCPSDHAMIGMRFGWTRGEDSIAFVDYVELICQSLSTGNRMQVCLQTGHGCWDKHPNPPPPTFPPGLNIWGDSPFVQNCPAMEAATGLRGRSGIFVDALGLICSPAVVLLARKGEPPPQRPVKRIGLKKMIVALPVEVYDSPGGNGQKLGDLDAGTTVGKKKECNAENWCNVRWNGGQTGFAKNSGIGWVYNGPDYRSLREPQG